MTQYPLEVHKKILEYIHKARRQGLSENSIEANLRKAGWDKKTITLALTKAVPASTRAPLIRTARKTKKRQLRARKLIWYGALFSFVLVLLVIGSTWLFVTTNVHIGSWSYAKVARRNYVTQISRGAVTVQMHYTDPGSVRLRQGSIHLELLKPEANFELTVYPQDQHRAGLLAATIQNGTVSQSAAVVFTTRGAQGYIKPQNVHFTGPLLGKLNTLEGVWLEIRKPFNSKVFDSLVHTGTNLGIEEVNGEKLLHFEYRINLLALGKLLQSLPQGDITVVGVTVPSSAVSTIRQAYVQGVEATKLEVWTTVFPTRLRRAQVTLNAPSVAKSIAAQSQDNISSQDNLEAARILADTYQLQTALENFKNSNGGFPGGSNGQVPNLLPSWPIGTLNKNCPERYRQIYYNPESFSDPKTNLYASYSITFCLPEKIGELAAGIGILTPSGLITQTTCPNSETKCFVPAIYITPLENTRDLGLLSATIDITITPFTGEQKSVTPDAQTTPLTEALKDPTKLQPGSK